MNDKKIAFDPSDQEIAAYARALSHPVRVYILKKLSGMNACCYSGDLVDELPIGRSSLSQHLKELKHAGLIQGEIKAPYIKYCINKENWEKVKAAFAEYFGEAVLQNVD
ncbi:MAG: ArsR family transcriptional regulator [Bacteroidia bacterium]|nr:MAG: ArsR family transcriptional regulator [Bacteroidia bacterium]